MSKNEDIAIRSLFNFTEDELTDPAQKIGNIVFTSAEKKELLKLTQLPGWNILKSVYTKQRLVQIAVANINMSQTTDQLQFYKGKSAEADYLLKTIDSVVDEMKKEQTPKS